MADLCRDPRFTPAHLINASNVTAGIEVSLT